MLAPSATCPRRSGEDTFVACDAAGTIAWYDAPGRKLLKSWNAHEKGINDAACAVTPSGTLCVAASRDHSLSLWRLGDEEAACRREAAHKLNVSCVDIASDASLVVSGSKDTFVRAWDPSRGLAPLGRGSASRNTVTCLRLMPGSTASRAVVAQGSEDLKVRLWDLRAAASSGAGAVLSVGRQLAGYVYFPLHVDVHPNGRHLLTSSRGVGGLGAEARVWDVRMPSEPVSASGADVASSAWWDAEAAPADAGLGPGVQVGEYLGHEEDAAGCGWVPPALASSLGLQGSFATASKDRTVRLWQVRPGQDGGVLTSGEESDECVFRHVDGAAGAFTSLAWLRGGDRSGGDVVAGNEDGSLRLLRLEADGELRMVAESQPLRDDDE